MLKRMRPGRPSPALIVSLLALTFAMGGFAIAAIPDSNGVIRGCYKKKKGTLRLVSSTRKCKKSERGVSWNQQGRAGSQGGQGQRGLQGTEGLRGPSDAFSAFQDGPVAVPTSLGTIATLGNLPAGKYVIVAKAWFQDLSTGSSAVIMDCRLTAGGDFDRTRFELEDADDPQAAQYLAAPFNVVHEFASNGGSATLDCADFGVNTQANDVKITATKVASLSNTASP